MKLVDFANLTDNFERDLPMLDCLMMTYKALQLFACLFILPTGLFLCALMFSPYKGSGILFVLFALLLSYALLFRELKTYDKVIKEYKNEYPTHKLIDWAGLIVLRHLFRNMFRNVRNLKS